MKFEKIWSWVETAEKIQKVVFHQKIQEAFREIYLKANGYEVFFLIPGEIRENTAYYRSLPLIVSQICTQESVIFLEDLPISHNYWWFLGHTHPTNVIRLSGNDEVYCAYLGILCTGVVCNGYLTDICRFTSDWLEREKPYAPIIEWTDKIDLQEEPVKNLNALPYTFLPKFPSFYEEILLIVNRESQKIDLAYY